MFIIDDIINAIGAENASQAQQKQARDAMALQQDIWGQQQANQAPYLQAGRQTLADLLAQMQGGTFDRQFDASALAGDPGFQFRMAEGQKALERSASARGGLNSGGTMKSLARYSQGLASDEFQNAWSRDQAEKSGRFGRMSHLAGMGQNAAQSLGQFGSQYANNMGQLYGAIGNAQAAGATGVANGISGGVQSLGSFAMGLPGVQNAFGFGGGGGLIPKQRFGGG